ncbi:FK506-binding protein 2 [Candida tropicalis]
MKTSFISIGAILLSQLFSSVSADEEGTQIEYLNKVECNRKTKKGDYISVHYKGTLGDGTEFDSSFSRGIPLPFNVGSGQVIKCWDEGLLDMCIGEKRILTCPPGVAYGERGIGPIPPNAVLTFFTELVDIAGVDKEEEGENPEKDEL